MTERPSRRARSALGVRASCESDETLAGVESRTLAGANAQINHSLEGGMRNRRVRVHFRLSNLQKLGRGGLLGEQ